MSTRNAWEKEADKNGDGIWVRTWGFLDRDDATSARALALNRIEFMDSEYSGCDWCIGCGNGLLELQFYQSVVRLANKCLAQQMEELGSKGGE